MGRVIVALSGGKASAWCGDWALRTCRREDVVLYFNDTRWEHPDLYRFLEDLSRYWGKEVVSDSDGRSPEELFVDNRALANNRMPFCSKELKAQRLHRYCGDGDVLVFGIGLDERHRAKRIAEVYGEVARKRKITLVPVFPLIAHQVTPDQIDAWLRSTGIEEPALYKMGFKHNNCSGGCVRSGKSQWLHLLKTLPEVYAERERVEEAMREWTGKDISYLKTTTLRRMREAYEAQIALLFDEDDDAVVTECIGICALQN